MLHEKVSTWMTPEPITIAPDQSVLDAYHRMREHEIRRLPVVENGRLIGIITISDVRGLAPMGALSILEHNRLIGSTPVRRAMTPNPITISPDQSLGDAARLLMIHKFGGLPVVSGETVVGVISEADIFRLLIAEDWGSGPDTPVDLEWGEPVRLRNEEQIRIRPIRPDDAAGLQDSFVRMSPETIYDRFLGSKQHLSDAEARRLSRLDYERNMALVATVGPELDDPGSIIGVARYHLLDSEPGCAEFAIVVGDSYQRLGLGTLLMKRLIEYAYAHGVKTFLGITYPYNVRLVQFVYRSGLPVERTLHEGLVELRIELGPEPYSEVIAPLDHEHRNPQRTPPL
ncbi:MAG TPA: GNAT family N-acetyltransferase [Anaerolineales bacterium]|nr:GNAT family N-acetyltransferase [Anaerolineales bacterium]